MKYAFVLVFLAVSFFAQGQYVAVPDPVVRSILQTKAPTCFNASGELDTVCAYYVLIDSLDISDLGLTDIFGVQYFQVNHLDCSNNLLGSLPTYHTFNGGVANIDCSNNQLTNLDGLDSLGYFLNSVVASYNLLTEVPCNPLEYTAYVLDHNLLSGYLDLSACGTHYYNLSHNQITQIKFPDVVHTCILSNNNLTDILNDTLYVCCGVSYFVCSYNSLSSLPVMRWVDNLFIDHNAFTTFPTFDSLTLAYLGSLDCSYNSISSIPAFPSGGSDSYWGTINCSHNQLTDINALAAIDYMHTIDCSYNQLAEVDSLSALPLQVSLYCSHNQITHLPVFGSGLWALDCGHNPVSEINQSPTYSLACSNTPVACLPPLANSIVTLDVDSTPLTCLPNIPSAINSALPVCVSADSICITFPAVKGSVYLDYNGNGSFDGVDKVLPHRVVTASPSSYYAMSDSSGNYIILQDTNQTSTISLSSSFSPYYTVSPSSYTIVTTGMGSVDTAKNFAVYPMPNVTDLQLYGYHYGFVPGFTGIFHLNYKNIGTTSPNAIVKCKMDPLLQNLNPTPAPSFLSGDTLVWDIGVLEPFGQGSVSIGYWVDTNLVMGTPINLFASVEPVQVDTTPWNNLVVVSDSVISSYDPNEKKVDNTELSWNELDSYLTYVIHFQNLGTNFAYTVKVVDTLDAAVLDIASLEVIGVSHEPYTVTLTEHGILTVRMHPIWLYPATWNWPLSQGYVQFKIKAKPELFVGDAISNRASIYFDYNDPVLTNTATTNIVPTFIQDVSRDGKVNVYPVPVSDVLYVNAPQAKSTGLTCRVVNAYGQVLSTRSLHAYPAGVDVSMLIPGVYLLVIDDADGYFGTVRFIKQ